MLSHSSPQLQRSHSESYFRLHPRYWSHTCRLPGQLVGRDALASSAEVAKLVAFSTTGSPQRSSNAGAAATLATAEVDAEVSGGSAVVAEAVVDVAVAGSGVVMGVATVDVSVGGGV